MKRKKIKDFAHAPARRAFARLFPGDAEQRQAGLTFIETIIVVAIIMIFATAVTVVLVSVMGTTKEAAAKNQIGTFVQALELYNMQCGSYPTAEQGLAALRKKPAVEPVPEGWRGPYISGDVPKDPWTHDYKYVVPGPAGDPYGVISYGADGVEGGDGDNKDITSWQ